MPRCSGALWTRARRGAAGAASAGARRDLASDGGHGVRDRRLDLRPEARADVRSGRLAHRIGHVSGRSGAVASTVCVTVLLSWPTVAVVLSTTPFTWASV